MPGKSKDATDPAKMKKFQFDDDIPQRLQREETTIDEVKRKNAKNGGCMQIKGFGKARRPKK